MPETFYSSVGKFYNEYITTTSKKLKLIDSYLLYILLTGIIQFVYFCLVGSFPFNSFLSGFISCVASFVLAGMYPFRLRNIYIYLYYINYILIFIINQELIKLNPR